MLVNLRMEMMKRKITIENIATFLSIHRNSVANKLDNNTDFSIREAFGIRDEFFPDLEMDYLFKRDLENDTDVIS